MEQGKYEFVRFNYVGHTDDCEKHWWFVAKTYIYKITYI